MDPFTAIGIPSMAPKASVKGYNRSDRWFVCAIMCYSAAATWRVGHHYRSVVITHMSHVTNDMLMCAFQLIKLRPDKDVTGSHLEVLDTIMNLGPVQVYI